MAAKKNPLSHLGWLGLLGVAGIFVFSPPMLVFLLFFFFFAYRKMPADELFWANVRKAAARAFAVNIGWDIVALLVLHLNVIFTYPGVLPEYADGNYIISEWHFMQYHLAAGLFFLGIILSLCVFFFTLMRIHRKEKKYLEAANAGN